MKAVLLCFSLVLSSGLAQYAVQPTNCVGNCQNNCQQSNCVNNCQNNCQHASCTNCQSNCAQHINCVPQPSVPCPIAPIICPTPTPHPPPYTPPNSIDETVIIINKTEPNSGSRIIERSDANDGSVITLSITNIIHTNNTIHAPVNITNHNIVNTPVYLSDSSHVEENKNNGGNNDENDGERSVIPDPQPEKCCSVITPRVCRTVQDEWKCSHHKYHRCGKFCVAPKIYLRTVQRQNPLQPYAPHPGYLDCSGCIMHQYHRCPPGCYNPRCSRSRGCQNQDQHEFCNEHGGEGCSEEDGYENNLEDGDDLSEIEYPIH